MTEYLIPITDKPAIQLLRELKQGRISQADLYRKISKYQAKKAQSFIKKAEYIFKSWMREEIEFIKKYLSPNSYGKQVIYLEVGEHIEIIEKDNALCLRIKIKK